MLIKRKSQLTGITRELDIPVTEEQLHRWLNGELIQRAMPNLSSTQREYLMTGITDDEWETAFREDNTDQYEIENPL